MPLVAGISGVGTWISLKEFEKLNNYFIRIWCWKIQASDQPVILCKSLKIPKDPEIRKFKLWKWVQANVSWDILNSSSILLCQIISAAKTTHDPRNLKLRAVWAKVCLSSGNHTLKLNSIWMCISTPILCNWNCFGQKICFRFTKQIFNVKSITKTLRDPYREISWKLGLDNCNKLS